MRDRKTIFLDYYDGAYGQTLRIDIESPEELVRLKKIFGELADGHREQLNLLEMAGVKASPILRQVMLSHDPSVRPGLKAVDTTQSEAGVDIRWVGSPAYWSRCAGLVDGLLEFGRAAHQYLSQEGFDDALIELAFMERIPATIPGVSG